MLRSWSNFTIMLRTFLLAAIIAFSATLTPAFAQKLTVQIVWKNVINNPKSDTIFYDKSRKLTWNDFKGRPDPHHFAGAVTSSGFGYNSYMSNDGKRATLVVEVSVYFYKHRSWKKDDVHSDYHLAHEQLHFDITRLGAQTFYEKLKSANITLSNYRRLLPKLFDEAYTESNNMQKQYDFETKHSINIEQQMQWNEKVSKLVSGLPAIVAR